MAKRLTHDEWIRRHQSQINNSLELLSKYTGFKDKIKVKCKVCGNIYYTLPSVLITECKCKHCSIAKTNDEFVEELKSKNKGILPLEKYYSDNTPLLVKCLICDHIWKARPTHILRNHGCPKCGRRITGLKKEEKD